MQLQGNNATPLSFNSNAGYITKPLIAGSYVGADFTKQQQEAQEARKALEEKRLEEKAEKQREDNNQLFDWQLYGALIKLERTKQGIKNAALFSDVIYWRTRFKVSKDVLYRIEQNRQEPTAMQFVSINMALWKTPYPDNNLFQCLSAAWKYIAEGNGTPNVWKEDNFYQLLGDEWDIEQPVSIGILPVFNHENDFVPDECLVKDEDRNEENANVLAVIGGIRVIDDNPF